MKERAADSAALASESGYGKRRCVSDDGAGRGRPSSSRYEQYDLTESMTQSSRIAGENADKKGLEPPDVVLPEIVRVT